ncbi:MAG: chorismate synthase [Clostridiales bacterium]|nr:chorismate synthase [Clostridiales bacterium]
MAGSIYGRLFQISTWGESHGKGIGVVVDGCPAGLELSEADIQIFLDRRKPGQTIYSTPRVEADEVEILSGVYEGKTTGTPISMVVYNRRQRSADYSDIANYYRPGHADYTFDMKYGFRDPRGGGRTSGRETTARVAGGAIAMKILKTLGIDIYAYSKEIGGIQIDYNNFNREEISRNPVCMPDKDAAVNVGEYLKAQMERKDSVGGIIECVITKMPVGVGEPVFDKLEANLAKAIMSIGAIRGFEIGDGFDVAKRVGSENNDQLRYNENGQIVKESNHAGGVAGGLSDGAEIIFRAAVKATSSIERTQRTVNKCGENIDVNIKGRHDPIIVPRAVVVVEAMAALTVLDLLFVGMTSKLDNLKKFFID